MTTKTVPAASHAPVLAPEETRCPYCPKVLPSVAASLTHQRNAHEDRCRALGQRIARAGRRRRAAERGQDWTKVR